MVGLWRRARVREAPAPKLSEYPAWVVTHSCAMRLGRSINQGMSWLVAAYGDQTMPIAVSEIKPNLP